MKRAFATVVIGLAAVAAQAAEIEPRLDLDVGFRTGELDWSIAAGDGEPNVLSELTWSGLEVLALSARGELSLGHRARLIGSISYGVVRDGSNRDSDYGGSHRTDEFSRSSADSDGDYLLDSSVGLGYRLAWFGKLRQTRLELQTGWSHSKQNLEMTDGVQVVSEPDLAPDDGAPAPLGPFPGLDSTYRTQWDGPWVGAAVDRRVGKRSAFAASLRYHWSNYYAKANWNLRDDFAHPKSFDHFADGNGLSVSVDWEYGVRDRFPWIFRLGLTDWSTDDGRDRVFFSDGMVGTTRLNRIHWVAYTLSVGKTLRF